MPEEELRTADAIGKGSMTLQLVDGVAATWALKVWSLFNFVFLG